MDKKNIQAIYPLLNMQHGLLFHSLGNRKNDPGLLQVRFQIQGILDIERLRQSWDTVVQRNEALRMSVQMPQGHQPMMVVSRICQTKWTDLDLRRRSLEEQKSEVDAFLLNDQQKGLKLNSAPAFRIALFHYEENRFQVLWTCHHLFLDGWSAVIAIQKWMSEYEALFVDQVKDPIRQCSYREFLAVRRGLQEGDQLAQTVRFWKNYLNECLPVRLTSSNSEPLANLEKTTKHGQPRTVVTHCLGSELSTLANRFKVTSASLFHAILAMAFKVQTGTDDVLFGETTSGRNYDLDGMNSLLGCFSGVIPRRTIFKESDEILSEFVRRVNKSRFDSISYEHASMSQIEEAAGLVAGKLPMFDCLLVFENLPWKNIEPSDSGIKVTGYSAGITTTFPLTIVVKPATEDLTTSGHWLVEYSFDHRISQTLVTSLSKTVEVLVKKIGGNPDIKIGQLFDETAVLKSDEFPPVSADKGRVVVGDTLNQIGVQLAGNRLQIELSEIWEELLGINPIDVNTDFIQLGGRSILVLRMIAMIESRLGKKISLSDVIENPTIAGLAKKISDKQSLIRWRSLIPVKTSGHQPPVFFVHVGGGHALFFRTMAPYFPSSRPFFALQPVGLDGECEPITSFSEMARIFVDEIIEANPSGPIHLVGHCIGGRTLFAIANELRQRGLKVGAFIVLDTYPPKLPSAETVDVQRGFGVQIKNLAKGRLYTAMIALGRHVGRSVKQWYVPKFGDKLSKKLLVLDRVHRACAKADHDYRVDKYDGKVQLIRAEDPNNIELDFNGTCESWEQVNLPISHQGMFLEPDVEILTNKIVELVDINEDQT